MTPPKFAIETEKPEAPVVLLIDDSAEIFRLLSVRLHSENLQLVHVASGPAGIEYASERSPAAILLDLNLPGFSGFDVLRALKDSPATVHIPVIIVSSSDQLEDKVAGLDLGAFDYVTKPFSMPELRARLRSAIRISELMSLLAERAQVDGLTGLWNRAHFDERLREELAASQRSGRPISLCLCDLDHFKLLNDRFGHAAGDAVLKGFSRLVCNALRQSDLACRYGGEEFAIILRDTDARTARIVISRIRVELEQHRWAAHPDRKVTASFGICDHVENNPADPTEWIETADQALYAAKSAGRNRIVVWGVDDGSASKAA